MKRPLLFLFLSATVVVFTAETAGFGQAPPQTKRPHGYYTVLPLRGVTSNAARVSAAAATTIPMWDYSITSPLDGLPYSGTMVGRSPFFHGARTTDVPTIIVPIKIVMSDGTVFDPTKPDTTCLPSPSGATALALVQESPVLQPAMFTMGGTIVGTTQYPDAFQRSNFWMNVSVTGDRYHTMLDPVTTLGPLPVTVTVPTGSGATNDATASGGCGKVGVMDINWWQPYVEGTLIPSLQGVSPITLPLFLFYNVVMTQGPPFTPTASTCCILGYHGAFSSPGSAIQTYSPFDFDTTTLFGPASSAISAMSHEVAEWMDDPLGFNPTPAWGNIGQVMGCQNTLEVGDPLSGSSFPSVVMPNGVTYAPQELAFFSWFYRQSHSIGVNGWYSDNGTFTTGQGTVCM
jgi:hypothetical protein